MFNIREINYVVNWLKIHEFHKSLKFHTKYIRWQIMLKYIWTNTNRHIMLNYHIHIFNHMAPFTLNFAFPPTPTFFKISPPSINTIIPFSLSVSLHIPTCFPFIRAAATVSSLSVSAPIWYYLTTCRAHAEQGPTLLTSLLLGCLRRNKS